MNGPMSAANMQMFKLQSQIKNNNNDLQAAVSDLLDWSTQANTLEKQGQHKTADKASATQKKLPPIRNKIDIGESILKAQEQEKKKSGATQPNVPELEKFKRDSTAMPDYYKAWDKFGKKLEEMDEDDDEGGSQIKFKERREPQTQAEMMAKTSGAAPNTTMVVRGGLRKPVSVAEEFK